MKDIIFKEIALFLSILTVLSSVACSKQNTENDISAVVQDNNEVNRAIPRAQVKSLSGRIIRKGHHAFHRLRTDKDPSEPFP